MFVITCKIQSNISDDKFRDIIFEVIPSSESVNRFD